MLEAKFKVSLLWNIQDEFKYAWRPLAAEGKNNYDLLVWIVPKQFWIQFFLLLMHIYGLMEQRGSQNIGQVKRQKHGKKHKFNAEYVFLFNFGI